MITLVCHRCRRFEEVGGEALTAAHVFDAARREGWTVVAERYCYCPPCAALRSEG